MNKICFSVQCHYKCLFLISFSLSSICLAANISDLSRYYMFYFQHGIRVHFDSRAVMKFFALIYGYIRASMIHRL